MKVNLTIFKPSGKYYMDESYQTKKKELFEIWDEVLTVRDIPDGWIVLVDVPRHPYKHPHLVFGGPQKRMKWSEAVQELKRVKSLAKFVGGVGGVGE